ncbi:5'-methylthioadenosine/S-adenosylhomocysteine nucleosidase [Candidatus Poribacteria bacterium]|nr:5'-methylthioadenosine/S-adenosylhomocysteine nucleosidase [Candidatus Poribacteria bacterium]
MKPLRVPYRIGQFVANGAGMDGKTQHEPLNWPLVFAAVLMAICSAANGAAPHRVAVICTFAEQKARIVSVLEEPRDEVLAGRGVTVGRIGDLEVAAAVSPMGLVNNAITAQALVDSFQPDGIVSIGMAGGVALEPGEMFYANRVVQHDKGTVEEYGAVWSPIPEDARIELGWMGEGIATVLDADGVSSGTLASGSQFIKSAAKRGELARRFDAVAVDMQGSALAMVAEQNGLPVLILRTISDRADNAARSGFQSFAERGGGGEADKVAALLEHWARPRGGPGQGGDSAPDSGPRH